MESQQLQETILKELPALIQNNKAFRQAVIKITRHQFADKVETESRFDRLMNELVQHRPDVGGFRNTLGLTLRGIF